MVATLIWVVLSGSSVQSAETIHVICIKQAFSDAIQAMSPEFTKETGIKVEFDLLPWTGLLEKETIELQAGTGAYDVVGTCTEWVPFFGENKLLISLNSYIEKYKSDLRPIISKVIAAHSWKGDQIGMPVQADTRILYYRKDWFDQFGLPIPNNWDEWYTVARKLNRTIQGEQVYGFTGDGNRYTWIQYTFVPFMYNAGADLFDENLSPLLLTPEFGNAVAFFKKMFTEVSPPGAINATARETIEYLKAGKAAMAITWSGAGTTIKGENAPVWPNLGYAKIPPRTRDTEITATAQIGGWALGIANNSPNKENAFKFLNWLIERKRAYRLVSELGSDSPGQGWIYEALADVDPSFPTTHEVLRGGKATYPYPEYSEVVDTMSEALSDIVTETKNIDEALSWANGKLYQIMARAGYYK
jgi:multiple sugar transport system substrate-binding protein